MSSDKEYQTKNLERIFSDGAFSPVFKYNPNYPIKEGVHRIAYSDVIEYKFIIRHDRNFIFGGNPFWNENAEVTVTYNSIGDLVDDGWRLD